MRILIAEDDPVARRLLEATLVRDGHEVVAVADGLEAIAVLARSDSPRLAIVDWMMPGADGLAVCRAARQRLGAYVYIILLTARHRQEDVVAGLAAEADDFLRKPFDAIELLARLHSGKRVLDLQQRLIEAQELLRHEATHDRLTRLPNRAMIVDQLASEMERAERDRRPLAVAIADIDHFKGVNDTYGHAAGDMVLREAAARMNLVRRPYDYLARYGGEEFLLLLPNCGAAAAGAAAERLRQAVSAKAIRVGTSQLTLTLSVGVACSSGAFMTPELLIQAADEALYRAKSLGRDCVQLHESLAC